MVDEGVEILRRGDIVDFGLLLHDLAQRNNPPYQKYAQSEDEKCQGGERNCRLPIADLAPLNFARLVEKSKTYEEHRSVKLDFFG